MAAILQISFSVFSSATCLVNFFERQVHIGLLKNQNKFKKTFEVILLKLRMILAFKDWTMRADFSFGTV